MGARLGWLVAASALLLLAAGLAATASAQQEASLAIDPPAQTVAPGGAPFEIRVTVDDVTNAQGLGGYTLAMAYDAAVLRALSVVDSGFAGSTGNGVVCPASGIDNDEGRLALLCFTVPLLAEPGPQTTEPQVLARVTFEAAGEGTTTLDISETSLTDPTGTFVPATIRNGTVTVQRGRGGPAPVETPAGVTVATPPAAGGTGRPTGGDGSLPRAGDGPAGESGGVLPVVALALATGGAAATLAAALIVSRRRILRR